LAEHHKSVKMNLCNSMIQYRYTFIPVCTIIFIVSFLFILSSCRTEGSNNLNQSQAASVKDSVSRLAANIAHNISHEGPNAWLHYFDKSPGFFMASGGKLVFPNYDSAAVFVQIFAKGVRNIQLTWSGLNVDPLTMDLAIIRASFHETITDTSGSQTPVDGYFTSLAVRRPEGWRLKNLHWSYPDQAH
jgi:hypothetical protein